MSSYTRREFFKHFAHDVSERVDLSAVRGLFSGAQPPKAVALQWYSIGSMACATPGVQYKAQAGEIELTVTSSQEGVSAMRSDGIFVALRAGQNGHIEADPSQEWSRQRILGHMTLEAIDLNDESIETTSVGEQS